MLIDAFMFNGEWDMLALRLRTLDKFVDRFVLVERDRTFRGTPKKLAFDNPPVEFAPWLSRIRYVRVTDDCGPFKTKNQMLLQYNQAMLGLDDAKDDDIVMLSDLDEIPDPMRLDERADGLKRHLFVGVELNVFHLWLNARLTPKRTRRGGIAARAGTWRRTHEARQTGEVFRRQGGSDYGVVRGPAGWHFSWIGPWPRLEAKLATILECQWDTDEFRTRLREGYLRGEYCLGPTTHSLRVEPIDATYPLPLQENPERWAHMIKEVEAEQ